MKQVAEGIADMVHKYKPLIISIAAGITIKDLARWLTKDASNPPAVVRCMPNTPALVSEGATGLYAPPNVTDKQKDIAHSVLSSISKSSYFVDKESLIDVITGISGSGPGLY
jgi:pyrroline-5-carboxylate reductase